jgi:hypothetical protein
MPDVNLPFPEVGKNDAETVKNLYDTVLKLRKELEWLLYNLDVKNVIKAQRAEISEIYAGTIEANKITTVEGAITTAQIETLTVGDNVTMGEDAYISWGNITDPPTIPDGYTDEMAVAAIDATYINEDGVWTPSVYATNINVTNGKISAAQIDTLSADQITAGNISLTAEVTMSNDDNSVYIDNDGIIVDGGKIIVGNKDGTASIMDGYGIDPIFLDYFKNLVYNSSFELFDADSNNDPRYWSGGASDNNSNFHGNYSLKLTAGQNSIQTISAAINPDWYGREKTRVAFYRKLGQVKIEIYDHTNSSFYTLTDEEGNAGSSITFDANANWQGSRVSVSFDPDEAGHTDCVAYRIKFTNVHETDACYIDAVQCHPDFTGKWPQLYKDGPNSQSGSTIILSGGADLDTTFDALHNLYVQTTEPAEAVANDVWVDTDDYSRYDKTALTEAATLTTSSNEFITASGTFTVTLHAGTSAGIIKKIYNIGTGLVTIAGTINGVANMMLYPNESVELITDGTNWRY